jgi:hypothetical protein
MSKQAISVTLSPDNLLWLRAQLRIVGGRSVSELLDQLITRARTDGDAAAIRSVVGSVRIDERDPDLAAADAAVRASFEASRASRRR